MKAKVSFAERFSMSVESHLASFSSITISVFGIVTVVALGITFSVSRMVGFLCTTGVLAFFLVCFIGFLRHEKRMEAWKEHAWTPDNILRFLADPETPVEWRVNDDELLFLIHMFHVTDGLGPFPDKDVISVLRHFDRVSVLMLCIRRGTLEILPNDGGVGLSGKLKEAFFKANPMPDYWVPPSEPTASQ